MSKISSKMKRLAFLIGDWQMTYHIPHSRFSSADKGKGSGSFSFVLNNQYVFFDYEAELTGGPTAAHGIFAWDAQLETYRFWWFENSGNISSATANFIDDTILHMNWQDSLFIQTFQQISADQICLRMLHPEKGEKYQLVLQVDFQRR